MYAQCLLRMLVGISPGLLLAGAGCTDDRTGYGTATAPVGAAAVSTEVAVDQAVHRPVPGRWPAAAFDGTQYLVVWEDFRAGRQILYGGRVTADGNALDAFGFPILDAVFAPNTANTYSPVVAFDGVNFLVVTAVGGQIIGVRVSAAGEVLDPDGIVIAGSEHYASRPSLVFDGEQYLVAWSQDGVYWARVTPDGTVLDPDGVLAHAQGREVTPVGVSFDGTNFLLSWASRSHHTEPFVLEAGRIAPDGTLIDETPIRVSTIAAIDHHLGATAGFDGTNHVIAWSVLEDPGPYDQYRILASRVTPAGTILDPDGIQVALEIVEAIGVHRLDMTAGSGRSVVVWSRDYGGGDSGPSAGHVKAAEIAADGTVSVHPADTFSRGLEATLATHADGALLLWREGEHLSANYPAIVGTLLDAAGRPVAGSVVAPASPASRQHVRAVASDGQSFFVLWNDTRDLAGAGKALYGARVAADGTPLDPEPIQFTTQPAELAEVVFDGASFVVTWVVFSRGEGAGTAVRTARVSPAGELLDTTPLFSPLSASERNLVVASDGTHTLLVADSYDVYADERVLAAMLLDQDGAVASDVVVLARRDDQTGYVFDPEASFDGTEYLVVWYKRSPGGDAWQVLGQRVSTDGALLGQPFVIASRDGFYALAVGGGDGNRLVVWQDAGELFATRVGAAGQVLDPDGRLIAEIPQVCDSRPVCLFPDTSPAVTFDGKSFVVAWREPSAAGDESSIDLYGAEIGTSGEVLRRFAISEGPEPEGAPFLAAGGVGQVMAAYSRFVPGAPYDSIRARARLLESEVVAGPDAGPPGPTPDAGGSPVDPGMPPGPPGGEGCGCRVGAEPQAPVAPLLLLGVVVLWLVRRRSAR